MAQPEPLVRRRTCQHIHEQPEGQDGLHQVAAKEHGDERGLGRKNAGQAKQRADGGEGREPEQRVQRRLEEHAACMGKVRLGRVLLCGRRGVLARDARDVQRHTFGRCCSTRRTCWRLLGGCIRCATFDVSLEVVGLQRRHGEERGRQRGW